MVRQQLLWSLLVAVLAIGGLALYASTRPPTPVYYDDPHRDWTSSPYAKSRDVEHVPPPMLARDDDDPPTEAAPMDEHAAEHARRDAACHAHPLCAKVGNCAHSDRLGWDDTFEIMRDCGPANDEDCKRSETCKLVGFCHRDGLEYCGIDGDADCEGSDVCRLQGWCTVGPERDGKGGPSDMLGSQCQASSDEDCKRGSVSRAEGRIHERGGYCVRR